jgi:DnaJ family protein C protein 28
MSNIEEHIRRAMEEGLFEDLPGKGKPLRLDDDSLEDPEWRMANHIMRNSGFSLPWIEKNREIETALETARATLKRCWAWSQASNEEGYSTTFVEEEWQKAVAKFRDEIQAINQQIASYNLEAPSLKFQRQPVKVEKELARLTASPLSDTL